MSEFNNAGCNGDCGSCGSDCDSFSSSAATVTLTLDNDEVVECQIITIFSVQEQQYIALLPLDENGKNEDGEVYLYRFSEENGAPSLANIEDDDEYEAAADAFDEWLDSMEFDQLEGIVETEN